MTETAEAEIRELFKAWSDESAARDVDALMKRIAHNVVAFEHQAPLRYSGIEAVRQICQQGFEAMKGDFRWSVEDLQVIARENVAVAWGVSHMRSQQAGGEKVESRSRGTWVFQKSDGAWKVIHHHHSYPFDPQSGAAIFDLKH